MGRTVQFPLFLHVDSGIPIHYNKTNDAKQRFQNECFEWTVICKAGQRDAFR